MRLLSIRRYPVKAMGGEPLDVVEVDERGLVGDRRYAVVDADGKLATGKNSRRFRRYDQIFDYQALTSSRGILVTTDGGRWWVGDDALDAHLSDHFGAQVAVAAENRTPHFDAGAVSVVGTASLDWCRRELGVDADPRRLRVNLVVETDEPFVEESWAGVGVGTVVLGRQHPITRCRVIDLAQDGVEPQQRWLTRLGPRDQQIASYFHVDRPGMLAAGREVVVLEAGDPALTLRGD